MIADDGISVVTPQGAETSAKQDELKQLIEGIRHAPVPDLKQLRRLQPYTTNLHPSVLRQPGVMALLRPILGGDEVRQGVLVEWADDHSYDEATGITLDPNVEQFVL